MNLPHMYRPRHAQAAVHAKPGMGKSAMYAGWSVPAIRAASMRYDSHPLPIVPAMTTVARRRRYR